MIIGNEKSNAPSRGKRMYQNSNQNTFSLNYQQDRTQALPQQQPPTKKADDVYQKFQAIQDQQSTNQPKEMVTFDAEGLQKYYEEQDLMNDNYKYQQQKPQQAQSQPQQPQYQQQQQPPQQQGEDVDDVEKELAKLRLEQEELERQIAQQMKENEDIDTAISYQQQQKELQQQQSLQPLQEKYQQQRPSQMASQNILNHQPASNASLAKGQKPVSSNIQDTYNQQFQNYDNKQQQLSGARQSQDKNEGLIGNHGQGDLSRTGKKLGSAQGKQTNLFGDQYDYFADENRLNIDQRKNGHLTKLPQNYDKMAAYSKNQQTQAQQQQKINNRKYQPTNLW